MTLAVAQSSGTVNFANNSSCLVINGQTQKPVALSDGIQAALYWAPSGSNNFVQLGAAIAVGVPLPGLFAGRTLSTGAGTTAGGAAQFQVKAWSGGYASFEQAASHGGVLLGESSILQGVTGNPAGSPPAPPNSLAAYGLGSFMVSTSPPPPFIRAATLVNGGVNLVWTTIPGMSYQAQYTTNLVANRWTALGPPITALSNALSAFDGPNTDPIRFYRVILLTP